MDHLSPDHIHALAGAIAGVTAGVVVCPLDVAKTKLQAQGALSRIHLGIKPEPGVPTRFKYSGVLGTIRTILKDEGVRGLYRGLGPIIIGYIPTWTVYFYLYEKCKVMFAAHTPLAGYSPFLVHTLSAMSAGAASTIVTNPVWVVKTRLMSQSPETHWHYKGTVDAFRTMLRTEGIRVFYSGLTPALLGLTHVAVQFPLYEKFKELLRVREDNGLRNNLSIIAASGMSKLVASTLTYPHEVIRTRNQIQNANAQHHRYYGLWRTVRVIYIEEGWRAFYAGLGTNMVRAVPSSAVTLLTYEVVSRNLMRMRALNS